MKLSELIDRLQEMQAEAGPDSDPEVKVAYQPNYPMQMSLDREVHFAKSSKEPNVSDYEHLTNGEEEYNRDYEEWIENGTSMEEDTVYLSEAGTGYLAGGMAKVIGWR